MHEPVRQPRTRHSELMLGQSSGVEQLPPLAELVDPPPPAPAELVDPPPPAPAELLAVALVVPLVVDDAAPPPFAVPGVSGAAPP
jgi:hypothetical protein